MLILAKAIKGQEFLYSASSSHKVSKKSAEEILNVLNSSRYELKDNEVWHKFEVNPYENAHAFGEIQAFIKYKGKIKEIRR